MCYAIAELGECTFMEDTVYMSEQSTFDINNTMPIDFNQNFGNSSQTKPFVNVREGSGISGNQSGAGYQAQVSAGIHSNRGFVGIYGSGGGSFQHGWGGGAIGLGGGFRFR